MPRKSSSSRSSSRRRRSTGSIVTAETGGVPVSGDGDGTVRPRSRTSRGRRGGSHLRQASQATLAGEADNEGSRAESRLELTQVGSLVHRQVATNDRPSVPPLAYAPYRSSAEAAAAAQSAGVKFIRVSSTLNTLQSLTVVRSRSKANAFSPAPLFRLAMVAIATNLDHYAADLTTKLPRELLERLLSFTVAHLHASSSIVGAGAVPSGRLPSLAPPVLPTITLKVVHPGTSTSAATSFTARFSLDTPLSDFLKSIYARFAGSCGHLPLDSYALFCNRRWLASDDRTLAYYDLRPGDRVLFRRRECLLRITFMGPWPSRKTFVCDGTLSVSALASSIASRLGFLGPNTFSLRDSSGHWLTNDLTLAEQGYPTDDSLTTHDFRLAKQYYFGADVAASSSTHLEFQRCLDANVSGVAPHSFAVATRLAALHCQVRFGDRKSATLDAPLTIDDYLPRDYAKLPRASEGILTSWGFLAGCTRDVAMCDYIRLSQSSPSYGLTFFRVRRLDGEVPTEGAIFLLGISEARLRVVADTRDKEILFDASLSSLASWRVLGDRIFLNWVPSTASRRMFGEQVNGEVHAEFALPEAPTVSEMLCVYMYRELMRPVVESTGITTELRRTACSALSVPNESRRSEEASGVALSSSMLTSVVVDTTNAATAGSSTTVSASVAPPRTRFYSPLYVDPSQSFVNPLAEDGSGRRLAQHSKATDTNVSAGADARHFSRVARALADMSKKMVRSLSARSSNRSPGSSPGSSPSSSPSRRRRHPPSSTSSTLSSSSSSTSGAVRSPTNPAGVRQVRVLLVDGSEQRFAVDAGKSVASIAFRLGVELDIRNPEEWSLRLGHGQWLVPHAALASQVSLPSRPELIETAPLLQFAKKFFYHDPSLRSEDPIAFDLAYHQAAAACRGEERTPTPSLSDAARLVAAQLQVNFGAHSPTIHKAGFLTLEDLHLFASPAILQRLGVSFEQLANASYAEHAKLHGIKSSVAKDRLVKLASTLRLYGAVFFSVDEVTSGSSTAANTPPVRHLNTSGRTPTVHSGSGSLLSPLRRLRGSASSSSSAATTSSSKEAEAATAAAAAGNATGSESEASGGGGGGGGGASDSERSLGEPGGGGGDLSLPSSVPPQRSNVRSGELLGISRDSISLHASDADAGDTPLFEYPLTALRFFSFSATHIKLDFGSYARAKAFATTEGVHIAGYLADYIDFLQRKMVGSAYARAKAVYFEEDFALFRASRSTSRRHSSHSLRSSRA